GLRKLVWQIVSADVPKAGVLRGTDELGNKYFENVNELNLRDRWVEYNKYDYDASMVPPGWRQWLNRTSDDVPTEQTYPRPSFHKTWVENQTGTTMAYRPYSTVKPKVESWAPQIQARK
ncbi:hypothetical protein CXG81DRAFT_14373, partial [Caulochytrium protostelioides]